MSGNRRDVSPAQPKACAGAERDRCDLRERSRERYHDRNRGKRDACARTIRREASRHAPDGLTDDRDSDELEAVQETFRDGSGECGRAHREGKQDQGRGHGEGEPRRKAAQKAIATENAEAKADLAGGRSRQKLAERDQVRIGRLVEPFAPHDEFIPIVSEMSDRTAKGGQAQFQERRKDLTDRPIPRDFRGK